MKATLSICEISCIDFSAFESIAIGSWVKMPPHNEAPPPTSVKLLRAEET